MDFHQIIKLEFGLKSDILDVPCHSTDGFSLKIHCQLIPLMISLHCIAVLYINLVHDLILHILINIKLSLI